MTPPEDPIAPIGADPADPPRMPDAPRPTPPVGSTGAAAQVTPPPIGTGAAAGPLGDEALAPAVERAQLDPRAPAEPRAVEVRATVHDAAVHGDGIARAIELANRGASGQAAPVGRREDDAGAEPATDDRAQMLGGAAASAYSGQSAQITRTGHTPSRPEVPPTDPLAPTTRVGDGGDQERREHREKEMRDRMLRERDEPLLPHPTRGGHEGVDSALLGEDAVE